MQMDSQFVSKNNQITKWMARGGEFTEIPVASYMAAAGTVCSTLSSVITSPGASEGGCVGPH